MNVQMIRAEDVRANLPIRACMEAMARAMIAVSEGTVVMPPRTAMALIDQSGYFGLMPGSVSDPSVYGAKLVGLHPGNAAAGLPVLQGLVVLFDHGTGTPLAIVDGASITALRTGATSALATRLLARPQACSLGLLGCGVQAAAHLEAICAVCDIQLVRVWSRTPAKARAFAQHHAQSVKAEIQQVARAQDAAECDVVCAVTAAPEPVLHGEWLRPGTHVNLVGAHTSTTRESDTALIQRGRLYVDCLPAALAEAGDILVPIAEGAIDRGHIVGEMGELLRGRIAGRRTVEDVTVFKSVGIVAQDLIAAHTVYANLVRSAV